MPSVLFVFTSATKSLDGGPCGWWLPEAAHPYYILSPHVSIDFASPAGPNPPLDPRSLELYKEDAPFLEDEVVKTKLANAKKLSTLSAKDYDAIFYIGGHGPVIDLAVDADNIRLASEFYQAGKITSAVCHGPAALVGATDAAGKSIFAGKSFTGFSNAEEEMSGGKTVPLACVVIDGHLFTGQNPASAGPLAEAILKALQ
ncbi:class I glutamine amidotransferase-like protein [Mycena rebaudengoi]|nr:class I glutamine amidotransferase-like protein [Mycena rebaudengoi]